MSTFKHRDRLTIFAKILIATKDSERGKKKTSIMRIVNLNYPQANRYLHLLLTNGLLQVDGEGRYRPTKKGLDFIEKLESLNLEGK